MEMINRLMTDALDAKTVMDKVVQPRKGAVDVGLRITGENRKDRRARERAERKAASRESRKVHAD